jgi:hypothetical protein
MNDKIYPYETELRNALYPEGIKHPQQAEWEWMIKEVKRLQKMKENK